MKRGFYNGAVVEIAIPCAHRNDNLYKVTTMFDPTKGFGTGHEFLAKSSVVEPLVEDTFKLGTNVKRIDGTFEGTVVGYEYATNMAICVSEKIRKYNNERIRYVYAIHELEIHDPDAFEFVVGEQYRLADGSYVRAMQHVQAEDSVTLYTERGKVFRHQVPKKTTLSSLAWSYTIALKGKCAK